MRHDWVFDVLADLKLYAERNGLTATAIKAAEAIVVARAEIALGDGGDRPTIPDKKGHRVN